MLTRKQPGAVGVRPARTFVAASSQYLRGGESIAASLTVPFTIAGFFKPNVGTGTKTLWAASDSATDSYWWRLEYDETAGTLMAEAREAGTAEAGATGVIEGQWSHGAGIYTSSTHRVAALNGVLGVANTTAKAPLSVDVMAFGAIPRLNVTGYHDGALSTWGLWSVALDSAEIKQLALGAHPTTVRPGALIECWGLDRVGPLTGLVRGTVLSPVNGGSLAPGPMVQGPPTTRRFFTEATASGGATNYTLTGTAGTVAATAPTATVTRTRKVLATAGSVIADAPMATLRYARLLLAMAAAVLASGTDAVTKFFRTLFGSTQTVETTAPTATGTVDRVIQATSATVDVTAPSATLSYSGAPEAPVKKTFMLMGVQK